MPNQRKKRTRHKSKTPMGKQKQRTTIPNTTRHQNHRTTQTHRRPTRTRNSTKRKTKTRTIPVLISLTIIWIWVKNVIQSKKLPKSRNNLPKMQSRHNPQRPKPRGNLLHTMRIHTTRQQHTTHNTCNRRRPAWHQIYKGPMAEKTEKKLKTLYIMHLRI